MRRALIVMVVFWSACSSDTPAAPSGSTPPPSNTPPANRAPTVSASASPTFGIKDLTTYTFSAQGSDPDGDPITYRWSIGGGTYDGPTVRLTFTGAANRSATLNPAVTATDSKGATATASTSATIGSMTGTWRATFASVPSWNLMFSLEQTGGTVRGTFTDNIYGSGVIDPGEPGRIDANGAVEMRTKIGAFGDTYVRGTMDSSGRRIVGRYSGASLIHDNIEIVLVLQ